MTKGAALKCSWIFQNLQFSSDLGGSFLAKHLGWVVLVKAPQVLGERASIIEFWLCPLQSLSSLGMFWGSGGAVRGCKGEIYKTEPAESGALALMSLSVVFLEETPSVMCPWVCQRSPSTNSAVASLPVGSLCILWDPGDSVVNS